MSKKHLRGQIGNFIGNIIIFEHPACRFDYGPGLDVYHIQDKRFADISLYFDMKRFMAVFNHNFEKALKSKKLVITIGYNHILAQVITACLNKYYGNCLFLWKIVSFFHDDIDTAKIDYEQGENALDDKFFILLDMLDFPTIEKIEIPYDTVLTTEYLGELIA
jgi:hypothetical protein